MVLQNIPDSDSWTIRAERAFPAPFLNPLHTRQCVSRGVPSELASSHPSLAALKGCQEVLHLLVLWSLLSLPPGRLPPPTGLGLPQLLLHPPHLISPRLSAHPLPSLVYSIPLPRVPGSFPHPRQRLGQGGETLSLRAWALWGHHSDEEDGGGCVG